MNTQSPRRVLSVVAIVVTLALTTQVQADAPKVNSPTYGPEGNQYMTIGPGWGHRIFLPRGARLVVHFPFDESSYRENAVTIYDERGNLLAYRNNYAGNRFQAFEFVSPRRQAVYITSWHKLTRPGKGPWFQSPMRDFIEPTSKGDVTHYFFGFEDMPSNPVFNDAKVKVWKVYKN